MKTQIITSALILLSLATAEAQEHVDNREQRQEQRIEQGEQSGALTPREARKLERQQQHIENTEAKAASDGKVSVAEKRKLNRMQNRASENIYAKKHNNRRQR